MLRAVIPAAGFSARFRGVFKEMLPILYNGEITTALDVNIQQALNVFGANEVVIVSRPEKAAEHLKIAAQYSNVFVVPYRFDCSNDLLGSIVSGATVGPVNYDCILMLADTVKYFNKLDHKAINQRPFSLGLFHTNEPSKYSIVLKNRIYTKPSSDSYIRGKEYAWGIVKWPAEYNMEMYHQMFEGKTYDDVFNNMITKYGFYAWLISKYYDLGSFKAYAEYMVEYNERDSHSEI